MNIDNKIKEIAGSMNLKKILLLACVVIFLLVAFQAGILVGYNKAIFSGRLGDNYYRVLGGQDGMHGMNPGPRFGMQGIDVPGGHGAVGKIIQINLPTFIVEGPDNLEKVVHVEGDTIIRQFRGDATSTDLKVDDMVIVIGNPDDDGEIDAKLIRVVPVAQMQGTSSVTISQ